MCETRVYETIFTLNMTQSDIFHSIFKNDFTHTNRSQPSVLKTHLEQSFSPLVLLPFEPGNALLWRASRCIEGCWAASVASTR